MGRDKQTTLSHDGSYNYISYYYHTFLFLVIVYCTCGYFTGLYNNDTSYIEGGSVNRCFQVGKVSRKARCGKIGRRRRPRALSPRPVGICRKSVDRGIRYIRVKLLNMGDNLGGGRAG
jgi:hypothetical protein